MYLGKKILAVVPARAGSKGIPKKNLRKWRGLSLVGHVGRFLKKCKWIEACCISTDDCKIGREGKKHGLEFNFVRPRNLSGDRASSESTWRHAWSTYERQTKMFFDIALLLEPTSPERKHSDIEKCLTLLVKKKLTVVMTVEKIPKKYSAFKQLEIKGGKGMPVVPKAKNISRRQQLRETFIKNGSVYAATRSFLSGKKLLLQYKRVGLICTKPRLNIDTIKDLKSN